MIDRGVTILHPPPHERLVPKRDTNARGVALACLLCLSPQAYADVFAVGADGSVTEISDSPPHPTARQAPASLVEALDDAGRREMVNTRLLEAIAWAESRFNPAARSPAGAIGVMQLMPQTADALGVDPADTAQNVRGGATYLRRMLDAFNGDLERALAAYNAGPEAVRRYGGVPPYPETQRYVASILAYLSEAATEEDAE